MSTCLEARRVFHPQGIDPAPGERAVVEVDGRSIALFNVEGTIYAIDDSCPHAGASLAGGKLDGLSVQCRAHGLRFDLRTGCMRYAEGFGVRTYPVTRGEGGLEISLPRNPSDAGVS